MSRDRCHIGILIHKFKLAKDDLDILEQESTRNVHFTNSIFPRCIVIGTSINDSQTITSFENTWPILTRHSTCGETHISMPVFQTALGILRRTCGRSRHSRVTSLRANTSCVAPVYYTERILPTSQVLRSIRARSTTQVHGQKTSMVKTRRSVSLVREQRQFKSPKNLER